jgi:hypothetical protein
MVGRSVVDGCAGAGKEKAHAGESLPDLRFG